MIYCSQSTEGKFSFYGHLVKFDSTEGTQTQYTNDITVYEDMVKNFSYRFSNLSSSTVQPTEIQIERLNTLNTLNSTTKEQWITECLLFVQHGAIPVGTNSEFLLAIQEDYTTETKAWLDSIKEQKWESIKEYRTSLVNTGGYKVNNKWFHSDGFSRSQQTGLVLLGENIPQGLMWKTMDGSFIEMTPALAQGVFHAATLQDIAIFGYAEVLNTAVRDLLSEEAINTFDILQGWPETYKSTEGIV